MRHVEPRDYAFDPDQYANEDHSMVILGFMLTGLSGFIMGAGGMMIFVMMF